MAAAKAKDSKAIVEKVQNLVALAQDGDEDSEEARNAAVAAVRMMGQHDLIIIPRAEAVAAARVIEGAKDLAARLQKESTQKLLLGALFGYFAGQRR